MAYRGGAVGMRPRRPEHDPELVAAVADGVRGMAIGAANAGGKWRAASALHADGVAYAMPLRPGVTFLDVDAPNGATDALLDALGSAVVVCESGGVAGPPRDGTDVPDAKLHGWLVATPDDDDRAALRAMGIDVRVGDGGPPAARMARPPGAPHRDGLHASTLRCSREVALAVLHGPDRTAELHAAIAVASRHGDATDPPAKPWHAQHRGKRASQDDPAPKTTPPERPDPAPVEQPTPAGLELPAQLHALAFAPTKHRRRSAHSVIAGLLRRGWSQADVVRAVRATPLGAHYDRRAQRNNTDPGTEAARHVANAAAKLGPVAPTRTADADALQRMADAVAHYTWPNAPGQPRPATMHAVAVAVVGLARRAGQWEAVGLSMRALAERAGVGRATAHRAVVALAADGLLRQDGPASGTLAGVYTLDAWHPALRHTPATPTAPSPAVGPQHDGWRTPALGKPAWTVWVALRALGGPVHARAVAERVGYAHPATARRHLARLREAGLVELGPDGWAVTDNPAGKLDAVAVDAGTAGTGAAVRAEHRRQRDGWEAFQDERAAMQAEAAAVHAAMAAPQPPAPWPPPVPTDADAPTDDPADDPQLADVGPRPWDGVPPPDDADAPYPEDDHADHDPVGLAA